MIWFWHPPRGEYGCEKARFQVGAPSAARAVASFFYAGNLFECHHAIGIAGPSPQIGAAHAPP
jgi:hypothetical protein